MPLDLKKIEEKVDKALNNETFESLSQWLFAERFGNNAKSYVGCAIVEEISVSSMNTKINTEDCKTNWVSLSTNNKKNDEIGTNNYSLAA